MADIELVIKIDEELYNNIYSYAEKMIYGGMRSGKTLLATLLRAIRNGTPLPKGHGRLIDADALVKKMEEREEKLKDDRSMWETAGVETALDMYAPTIIEADGGDAE